MSHATPPPGPPLPPGPPGQPGGPYPGPQYQPPQPPPKSRKTLWIVLGVIGATLLLCFGGCGVLLASSASDSVSSAGSSSPNAPASAAAPTSGSTAPTPGTTSAAPTPDATSAAPPNTDGIAKFGTTVTTDEDEAITVSYLGSRLSTESDFISGPQVRIQRFKVTMKNGSTSDVQVNPFLSQATYGPEGTVAENNTGAQGAQVTVKPGRTGTATLEFQAPKAFKGNMLVTITTSLAGDDVEFQGPVK